MGLDLSSRTLERLYLILLSAAVIGLSISSCTCNDFDLREVSGRGRNWKCFHYTDLPGCFMCCSNSPCTELILPCLESRLPSQVNISYLLITPGMSGNFGGSNHMPSLNEGERMCQGDYSSGANLSTWPVMQKIGQSNFHPKYISKQDINTTSSYRLQMGSFPPRITVCLTNVKFTGMDSPFDVTTALPSRFAEVTKRQYSEGTQARATTTGLMTNSTGDTGTPTTKKIPSTSKVSTKVPATAAVFITQNSGATSISTSEALEGTVERQDQSSFPIWIIISIIVVVVFGICAIVVVFIRRRKLQEQKQESIFNDGRIYAQSKQKDTSTSDEGVTYNPTYGQDVVDDKGDEHHSYTEIKNPTNSELIYNSAYESLAPN